MSQSLRAVKRFRLRELTVASPKARIPPATTTSAPNQLQRPPPATAATAAAATVTATAYTEPSSRSGGSSNDILTTGVVAAAILNNPFVPHKNPKSGRWAPPKYSLRRQAELIKHARESGMLHLLPPGPKMGEAQLLQYLTTATEAAAAAAAAVPSTLSVDVAEQEKQVQVQALAREREEVVVASGLVSVRRKQEQEQEQRLEEGTQVTPRENDDGPRLGQECKDVAARVSDSDDAWTKSVEWVGTVRERSVAGADVGNRLYAGKKRMFKGHKWERQRERRVARTKMLLRDMDKRVQRFKEYRAKGKPLPLARRSNVLKKTQKLPF